MSHVRHYVTDALREEEVIISHILHLDLRGFGPTYVDFKLVEETKTKLGICDEDIYNFDEAGFIIGKITTQLPLDVSCFSPLKRAYSREVESLMRNYINHITKLEFLPAFKAAFNRAFTPANICLAFRGAGLVPLQPEAVLLKVDVQLRTPTPPAAALPEAP
ncbi:hypothetical protein PtrM4_098240 [Pyrenophora tritici-repentis]|uniref:Uncharacterized protein n=1 Tax=Pyrenophora tritici-repentis TaxID=45151 RepID=A0A834RYR4_9PLEO|nr:hypothetical protein PtrM4_098240 [Pyrenophora tritici-repentis]